MQQERILSFFPTYRNRYSRTLEELSTRTSTQSARTSTQGRAAGVRASSRRAGSSTGRASSTARAAGGLTETMAAEIMEEEDIDVTDDEPEAKSDGIELTDDERFICDDEVPPEPLRESDDEDEQLTRAIEAASKRKRRKRRREAENEENTPSADEQRAAEQLAAQAAEVRALRLATAGALVQQRAAELEAVEARVAVFKESGFGDKVQAARDHAAVAKAREELAKAKLKALQLAAEIVVRASAA